ncbi:unnamed protein product [Protopolystoma xenopodis]|uniref:Uncharacterized protein n=1 Tax=Protopolystoma xenopodis TaxID=117903 RepID=A0A3S5ARR5_9PLAT|nr:unnamed protein product [Protopolystoma xenopodis]
MFRGSSTGSPRPVSIRHRNLDITCASSTAGINMWVLSSGGLEVSVYSHPGNEHMSVLGSRLSQSQLNLYLHGSYPTG